MFSDHEVSERARAVASAIEPFAAQVYFSPECHDGYQVLGFGPSPGRAGTVALPDGAAYFASRGSVMGQVPGTVIAAAFAVFNPAAVVPAVSFAWSITDAATICEARTVGAVGQLTRILGPKPEGLDEAVRLLTVAGSALRPEGRPLYAGLAAQSLPDEPVGAAWRLADRLREYRGDAHTAAWTSAGLDAAEIGLMTELYWGLPTRSYVRTRAWTDADLDAADSRLQERGLVSDGRLTDDGRRVREDIELATDRQCRPIVSALGEEWSTLVSILEPWGADIRNAGGYLPSGPHDLAAAAAR